jgi:hypothetical protein
LELPLFPGRIKFCNQIIHHIPTQYYIKSIRELRVTVVYFFYFKVPILNNQVIKVIKNNIFRCLRSMTSRWPWPLSSTLTSCGKSHALSSTRPQISGARWGCCFCTVCLLIFDWLSSLTFELLGPHGNYRDNLCHQYLHTYFENYPEK